MPLMKTEFDQELFEKLKAETDMDPNIHDGSYELVQETVKAYKNVSINILNYLDLNCIYLMTVGTWKHSFDKKEETITKSHLLDEDKTHLISILRKIQQNAISKKYENREKGNPTCGMFGTGFYNFRTKTNDNSVKQFIKLCIDIIPEEDEEKIFEITEDALKTKINGMQTGSISQILHCLKPTVFPILNGHMGQGSVFAKLCIDVNDQKDSTQYILNCRKIKKYRDSNFNFKNYRLMDKLGTNVSSSNIWLLSWNEKEWSWNWPEKDCDYETWANGTRIGNKYREEWRCKNSEAKIGDECYVVKTGQDPRGIFAHGFVTKDSFLDSDGKRVVEVEFDLIRYYKNESIIPIETLKIKCPEQEWSPQGSGIAIQNKYHDVINELWEQLLEENEMGITDSNIESVEKYKNMLIENKNLILHGAPGTGKTFLAKQIAEAMGCSKDEIGFCQFHPSYDYTDFVEGLRPTKNNGFERKDGIFKSFCKKALQNAIDSNKSVTQIQTELSWQEKIKVFLDDAIENGTECTLKKNGCVIIESYHDDIVEISLPGNESHKGDTIHISKLLTVLSADQSFESAIEIERYLKGFHSAEYSYILAVYKKIREYSFDSKLTVNTVSKVEPKKYIFIIDEINRGELSKIFGELFFSIDPGYRGEEGRVNTQYQNLIEDDFFKDGFYIPNNVYIIGTMNDIDRSVESMDFAMRRRFTFVEVTAEESAKNMNITGEALKKMTAINKVITKMPELGKSYCIGAAYFKDADNMKKLWDLKISSLVYEYLRGIDSYTDEHKDGEKLDIIKSAYDNPDSIA